MTQKIIITILCSIILYSYTMDTIKSLVLYPLSQDNIKKIMACSDLESRKALRLTCHNLSTIITKDLVYYSPLILNRHDHKFYMVHAAQTDNEFLMKNLLNNANICNHQDALDLMLNFIPKETDNIMENLVITSLKEGNIKVENVSIEINTIIKKYRHEMFDSMHSFFPQVMALYKADKTMINQYICTGYNADLETIAINKLTALQRAVSSNNVIMIELLLLNNHENQINDADIDGITPLYLAEDIDIVKMLLQCKNIQPNKRTIKGVTPLYKAVCKKNNHLLIFFFLFQILS